MIKRKVGDRIAITGGNETHTLTCEVCMGPHGEKTLKFSTEINGPEGIRWFQFSPESMQAFLKWANEL